MSRNRLALFCALFFIAIVAWLVRASWIKALASGDVALVFLYVIIGWATAILLYCGSLILLRFVHSYHPPTRTQLRAKGHQLPYPNDVAVEEIPDKTDALGQVSQQSPSRE